MVNTKTSCGAQLYPYLLYSFPDEFQTTVLSSYSVFDTSQEVQYWSIIVEHQLVGDGTHREQAEHITAADAHEKVENVVDGASSVDGWLPVLNLDVIEETLDNDEAGGDGEDQDWNDV